MSAKPKAVVLVDPLSSGCEMANSIRDRGLVCVRLDTISEQARSGPLGPFLPADADFPECIHSPIDYDPFLQIGDDRQLVVRTKRLAIEISEKWDVRAVVAGSEVGVQLSDFLAPYLGCHGNTRFLVRSRRHKGAMKDVLRQAGLLHAAFFELCSVDDVLPAAQSLGYPLVIKTPCGSGTSLVTVCRDNGQQHAQARAAVAEVLSRPDIFGGQASSALAEQFIAGTEYAVNMFGDGEEIHVTDVWRYEKVSRGDVENIYYCDIYERVPPKVLCTYAKSVARAVGVTRGPLHAEIRMSKNGPVLMEVAARFAGGHMPHMLRDFGKFNVFDATLDVFLSGTTPAPNSTSFDKEVAIVSCPTSESFPRGKIAGVDDVKRLPSYFDHSINVAALEPVRPTVDAASCPVLVWLCHNSLEQLMADVDRTHALIKVEDAI